MSAIEICNVSKNYKELQALKSINFNIKSGEFFGLIGQNGAGKTTLIDIIAGLTKADKGVVKILGYDVIKNFREARQVLGVVPQELVFDPFFTVKETLKIQSGYYGLRNNNDWIEEIMINLNLVDKANTNLRILSGGMKRRVLIAQALVHRPKVIILDEPSAGVDIELRYTLWKFISKLKENGHTIILTTHYLEEAEELCDRIAILYNGKVIALDNTNNLIKKFSEIQLCLHFKKGSLPSSLNKILIKSKNFKSNYYILNLENYFQISEVITKCKKEGCEFYEVRICKTDLNDVFIQIMNNKLL